MPGSYSRSRNHISKTARQKFNASNSCSQLTGSVIRYHMGVAWEGGEGATAKVSMSKRFVFDEEILRIVFCPHTGQMEHIEGEI